MSSQNSLINWEQLPLAAVIDFLDPFAKDGEGRRIVEKMVDALTRLGIRNLAQLRSLAIDQFPARFGRLGLYCRQQLEGSRQVIWPAWQPPLQWIEKIDFMDSEYALSIEPLLFKAKSGLDRLLSRLRGGHLRADCLELTVRQERYSTVDEPLRKWVFEFIVPQSSTRGILPILRERLTWDLMRKPLFAPVQTISLEISRTSPARGHQNDFLNAESHFDEKMGTFFGQLEEFLGKGQVFWADITEDRFPEKSWVRTQIPRASEIDLKNRYPLRPTRVFKHPLPLKINKNRVSLKGRTAQISRTSAVERISSHWLEGFPARDYFILELKTGSVLWVFRGLGENYYLHGFYE